VPGQQLNVAQRSTGIMDQPGGPGNERQRVIELENSVCSLLLVDLFNRNLIPISITARTWRHLLNGDGLRPASWLFVYEVHRKQWLGLRSHGSFVDNDPFFGPLLRAHVTFYDERRNVRRVARSRQEQKIQTARIRHVAGLLDFYF
jgi:hypothetical protein